ncbi:hypothetical protein [Stutzerimonas xanthomarina]|uniref:hypothetical protein n=1 Tax=Stutzerimonas xanthomarina TaxID=271420 RepID=UPI003AA9944C
MSFTAKTILDTFKDVEIAGAPKLKHTLYLNYAARQLGYSDYIHFKRCVQTAPSDRIGDFYTSLMRKICAIRMPKEGVEYVRFSDYNGISISYDSHFIGWDKRGNEVRVPNVGHGKHSVSDFRSVFEEPLYVIETEVELFAWQWRWRSFAVIPVALAKAKFRSLFHQHDQVMTNPPIAKVKGRVARKLRDSGLI